jgi:lysine biosynthesis protein LysW
MPTSVCPECTEEVFVDADVEQGDTTVCDECGTTLVVVGLDPIELDPRESDADDSSSDDPDSLDDLY